MWDSRDLEQKVVRVLGCIGQGAAALSEAGAAVYTNYEQCHAKEGTC